MEVSPAGKVMPRRLLHLEKAYPPMEINPSGKVMLLRLLHPEKACSAMVVTPTGKVMLGGRSVLSSNLRHPCASTFSLAWSSSRDQVGRFVSGMAAPPAGLGWVVLDRTGCSA
jgi:hypothetical protein